MPPTAPVDPASLNLGGSIPSTSVVTAVTRRLLDHFTSGTVAPGSRLPPERRLAETFAVGRSAVREALAALEVLGVVEVRPGSGTYLRSSTSELLPQTLSWGMLLGEPKTRELVQVRHGLEVQAARLAATAVGAGGVTALTGHLEAMRATRSDFEAFAAADLRFHQELAEQAQNALLDQMLQSVRSLIRVWVERAVSDAEHVEVTCAEHAAVVVALEGRDPDAAARAMSVHMDSAGARLLATVEAGA